MHTERNGGALAPRRLLAAVVGTCIKMRAGLERIQRWLACASDPDANKSIFFALKGEKRVLCALIEQTWHQLGGNYAVGHRD